MRRVALLVEYDGSEFQGLQWQAHTSATIQGEVERAAAAIGSTSPRFEASGRTDTGVHAVGQVIAIDLPARMEERRIALAMNAQLPESIRVRRAVVCAPDFSPRHDARLRTYVYRLASREPVNPLYRRSVAFTPYRLDPQSVVEAAASFAGQWEFREWRAAGCQATRTLLTIREAAAVPPGHAADFREEPAPYWRFIFRARSFLHHQVRFIVGGIVAVGSGRLALGELRAALAEGRRPDIVKCEPACGLTFTHVAFQPGRDPFGTPHHLYDNIGHESMAEEEK